MEHYKTSDIIFQRMMKSGVSNIFKIIFKLNAESIKETDPVNYNKIKYDEALETVNTI